MEKFKEKIESLKATAQLFLDKNIKVYIRDSEEEYYFARIVAIDENQIHIFCFAPEFKKEKYFHIYWTQILNFKEYKPKEKV